MKKVILAALCIVPAMALASFNPQETDKDNVDKLGFKIVTGKESNKRLDFFYKEEKLTMCPGSTFGNFMKRATDFDVTVYEEDGIYGYKMTFTVAGDRIDPRPRPVAFYVPSTYEMGQASARIRAVAEFTPEGDKYQVRTSDGIYILQAMCGLYGAK